MTPQDKVKYYEKKLRQAQAEKTAAPQSLDDVIAGALMWAIDVGEDSPETCFE